MFVWNPLVSIGFLFLIISKLTSMSASHIPNMSKPSKARKRTKRIPNGSPTSTNLTLSDVPLSLRKIFGSFGNLPGTVSKLVCMKSSEKNRMTVSNVGIASVLSDPFGRTATEIVSYLLEHTADSMDEKAVRKLIKKGAKARSDEIIEAIRATILKQTEPKSWSLPVGVWNILTI